MKTKLERMKELVEQLNIYRDAYYNHQESIVSDWTYDDLYDDLVHLEAETGVVLSNSPTNSVGYEVKSRLEKVKHSHPMLSLDKTKDVGDLIKFAGDRDCILSCKCDGLTCLLTYESGKLVQAETRGNGSEGELITHNAMVFDNIPLTIPYTGHFEIEGEAIITYNDFNKINANLPDGVEPYKIPRNLASGSVRQLDSKIAKDRHIKFISWKVPTECGNCPNSFVHRLIFAKQIGFETVPFISYAEATDKEKLPEIIEYLKEVAKDKGYPIDGLVMTYNDIEYGESLGATSHSPKHSIAYKFYDEEYETELLDIEYSMGKSGILTPVAIFKPVEIDGTMVERASLSNLSVKADTLGVPYRGQSIWVTKRNCVVPKIERAVKKDLNDITNEEAITLPLCCPICGSLTEIVQENDSKILVCTNPDCKGKLLGKLVHFCSKDGVNIDGLSESTLEKFIELGWVSCFEDIYKLYLHPIESLEGFGHKSAQKLVESIEKSKKISLDKFICALSIPLIGRSASKTIAEHFNYCLEDFLNACYFQFDYTELEDFGSAMSRSINEYMGDHYYEVKTLAGLMTFERPEKQKGNSLEGKTFVITGSVYNFKNRNELKSKIESLGGKVAGSVSKNTDYLINNDTESGSSKNKKAKELGVEIISEEDFMNMIGEI